MDKITVLGKPFWVATTKDALLGPTLSRLGYWEPLITRIISSYLTWRPESIVFDIGANSGYFSVLAAEVSGGRARVFAYEPEQEQFKCLIRNIRDRNCRGITPYRLAVGGSSGYVELAIHKTNQGDNRVRKSSVGHPSDNEWNFHEITQRVGQVCLDQHLGEFIPQIAKIDVQGYELEVLRGMSQLLQKVGDDFVGICEWTPKMMLSLGENPLDLPRWLLETGFNLYSADESKGVVERWDPKKIPSDAVQLSRFQDNLIFTKQELAVPAFYSGWFPGGHEAGDCLLELIVQELKGHQERVGIIRERLESLGLGIGKN
ncbi:MAG: FkbM family methyltransferase [Firmicutes bacterium]|nr:FkbM family methyltransferase [Alicyclobacillaceae bacterium]MCL6497326.1 FkbM family methyltransferase [Bacillota bacterium]